ncbi:hypothetical protein DOY81_009924 [Sarcophaga bullata]|nr:hypothetical protein DOY81_009924 [Sarcophaga bullata]
MVTSHSILANDGNGYAKLLCRPTTTEKFPLLRQPRRCEDILCQEMRDITLVLVKGNTVPAGYIYCKNIPEKLLSLPFLSGYENSPAHPYVMRNKRNHKHPPQEDLSYTATSA